MPSSGRADRGRGQRARLYSARAQVAIHRWPGVFRILRAADQLWSALYRAMTKALGGLGLKNLRGRCHADDRVQSGACSTSGRCAGWDERRECAQLPLPVILINLRTDSECAAQV